MMIASHAAQRGERSSGRGPDAGAERDMLALVLWPHYDPQLKVTLHSLGVEVSFATTQQIFQAALEGLSPELLLIDPEALDDAEALTVCSDTPLIVLAAAARGKVGDPIPAYIRTALVRGVMGARTRQAQREARARQAQLDLELRLIADMSPRVSAASSPGGAMQQLMLMIRDLYGATSGALYRYNEETGRLDAMIVIASPQANLSCEPPLADQAVAAWALSHSKAVLSPSGAGDDTCCDGIPGLEDDPSRSMLCMPLIARGRRWGVIQLVNPVSRAFTVRDLMVLRFVAAVSGPGLAT